MSRAALRTPQSTGHLSMKKRHCVGSFSNFDFVLKKKIVLQITQNGR